MSKVIIYTTHVGCNASLPRRPKWFIDEVRFDAEFTNDSLYDVGIEQSDWNKLQGIVCNPFNHADNTAFIGWRFYNGKFEIAPYYNINKANVMINYDDKSSFISSDLIDITKPFRFRVRCVISFKTNKITISTYDYKSQVITVIPQELVSKFKIWKSVRNQPYFGGNAKPKNDVLIKITYL